MDIRIEQSWKEALRDEFEEPYFADLARFVRNEYLTAKTYPPPALIFNAFERCPIDRVKVVIIGQDPYHGHGQAHGLSFSVPDGQRIPPSLQNIYKEIVTDVGGEGATMPTSGNLERWADQGVLLLNATLTVRAGQAGSHQQKGWERFTDAVIRAVSERASPTVFILWGNFAKNKLPLIDKDRHLALVSPHPSPFSANTGFFGSRPFSKANAFLVRHGREPIRWLP